METKKIESVQRKLERMTGKWWFYLVFVLVQFMIPPYVSKGYDWTKGGEILGSIFSQALIEDWKPAYPLFKVIPLILVILIIFIKNKVTRFFSIYVAIGYILFAVLQNIAITEEYGLAVVTGNVVMFLVVAFTWGWEAIVRKNDFSPVKPSAWKYWVVPLAFLAFWYPLNPQTMQPDFNPIYLLISSAGLAFCLMTPVYLAILTLYHPRVNLVTLRVTSLVGAIIAFYNMWVNFLFQPDLLWWNGVLHIPLLTISIYGLVISFKKSAVEGM